MSSEKVINNFLWRFFERCGAYGVTFIVTVLLARILGPEVSGSVALVQIFITIMNVFVDSGLGNALIQKKDADDLDFSSVFFFNMLICIVLYLIMFVSAPFIADFYNKPGLTAGLIRVLSLVIIVSGVKNVQQAYVSRNMLFKRFFFSTLGGTIGAAVIGLTMALLGFGIWALVAQMLFNTLVDTVILWITVKWRPKKMFSFERLKGLFSFGWKILVSSLIDTVYNDLRQLIIGKLYSSSDLSYYNQGKRFPKLIVDNINASIDSVLLPTLSKAQDDRSAVKNMTRRAIKVSTYLMMPCMVGLAMCADSLIYLLLGDEWMPCIIFLRVFCFTFAFYPIHTANLNAIKAMGRSDLFLKLEIIKKVVGLTAILATMWISVKAMAYSFLFTSICCQIINAWPNKKLLGYSYIEQLKDMLPQICLSLVMGAAIYCVEFLGFGSVITLCIQIVLGAVIYAGASKLLKIDSFEYMLATVKKLIGKGKKK
ncbi:MAG: lipopolysaccharide biosynthesis protein [Ruminococcus sp.]|nr:lipopolysaccharide biosynthesis protein [Ruminococcus sp.]